MIKLYKTLDNELHYWEAWDNENNSATIHWGKVGQKGDSKIIKSRLFSNYFKEIQKESRKKLNSGYVNAEDMNIMFLEIVYSIEGMGNENDLNKRHTLENRINELLGWTGLGHVDGGSIGSGTMEVGCEVVNFDIAKKVIIENLKGSEFSDYKEIIALEMNNITNATLTELLESLPYEVINLHVVDSEKLEERISAIGTIHANTIEYKEASIQFIPDNNPPDENEVLSWVWSFRPDLGDDIIKKGVEPEFKNLILSYKSDKMDEFWKFMSE